MPTTENEWPTTEKVLQNVLIAVITIKFKKFLKIWVFQNEMINPQTVQKKVSLLREMIAFGLLIAKVVHHKTKFPENAGIMKLR